MKNKKIKIVWFLLLILVSSLLLVGCGKKDSSKEKEGTDNSDSKTVIRLAVQPSDVQAFVAKEKGYFEEAGLDIELSVFSYGPPIIEAFTSKDIDVGFVGDLPAFTGITNNAGIEIIGTYNTSDKMHGMVVRNDANIHSFKDLKGKKISAPFGSNVQPLVNLFLKEGGLTEEDAEIVNLGCADAQTSIIKGDIDAAIIWEPYITTATAPGNGVSLFSFAEGIKTFVNPIIANKEYAEAHSDEIKKLLQVLQKAAEWSKENPDKAAQIVSDTTEADKDAVQHAIEVSDKSVTLDDTKIQALREGANQAYEYGLITKELNVDDYINTKYLEAAGLQ